MKPTHFEDAQIILIERLQSMDKLTFDEINYIVKQSTLIAKSLLLDTDKEMSKMFNKISEKL